MKSFKLLLVGLVFTLVQWIALTAFAATTGAIVGVIQEENSGNPLPGANVFLEGTNIGAATNYDGEYRIMRVPVGQYTLVVNFIGYQTQKQPIQVRAGATIKQDFKLRFETVEGDEVVVSAIREGQAAAINQQLRSNTIVNVVSAERIRELPDANAAESIGRLPGVSVQRESGEGEKVLIRGLSARFTTISVNGVRIPATEGYKLNVDDDDRSVDLSLISQEALAGIEVFKALTPDMDGDAVGGSVNFVLRHAPSGLRFRLDSRNGYATHDKQYGQTLNTFTISNRFLKDRLGVYGSGSYERKSIGSDELRAGYSVERGATVEDLNVRINSLRLSDNLATRNRYNASIVLDYEVPNHSLLFTNTYYRKMDEKLTRDTSYGFDSKIYNPGLGVDEVDINYYSNALSGRHTMWGLQTDWLLAHSLSTSKTPFSNRIWFQRESAFSAIDTRLPLDDVFASVRYDPMQTYLYGIAYREKESSDRDYTLSFDVKKPFNNGRNLSGHLKIGAKQKIKNRSAGSLTSAPYVYNTAGNFIPLEDPDTNREYFVDDKNNVLIPSYIDPNFSASPFLGGRFEFANQLDDYYAGRGFYDIHYGYNGREGYGGIQANTNSDYSNEEKISAGYLMGEFNITRHFMFLTGVRYERDDLRYNSFEQIFDDPANPQSTQEVAKSETDVREAWLPMFHIKIKPLEWFDVRLAATRSLSRPNYTRLRPRFIINRSASTVHMSGLDLQNASAWNYDLVFSFFNSRMGLFTIGGYYKKFENIDYPLTDRNWDNEEYGFTREQGLFGYTVNRYVNAPVSTIKGIEVDLQTHLSFLPSPFDGFVINANFTRAITETPFPQYKWEKQGSFPFYEYVFWREYRFGKMPGNSENMGNIAIGYEKKGFSCRISYLYQGDYLANVGAVPEEDTYVQGWGRWDATLMQKIGRRFGISFYYQNINNQDEAGYQFVSDRQTYSQYFGSRLYLGLRYDFR